MSEKFTAGNDLHKLSEILQAYFNLDPRTQEEVRLQVMGMGDSQSSKADGTNPEKKLAALLWSAQNTKPGLTISREKRLTPEVAEIRARMDKAEAAFAATLERLMAERQMTQAQLAEKIGTGQSAISMFLKRKCRPQRRTLGKLAAALEVPVEELWPGFNTGWQSGVL
jgi:DNA-binding XRE family transcriptional regulator